MNRTPRGIMIIIVILIFLILEYYSFIAFRHLLNYLNLPYKKFFIGVFFVVTAAVILSFIFFAQLDLESWSRARRNAFLIVVFGTVLSMLITSFFMLINDVVGFIVALIQKLSNGGSIKNIGEIYTRSEFLSALASAAGLLGLVTIVGGTRNKYNYKVREFDLKFEDLPEGLRGLKIIQLSDIHSGSFDNHERVQKGIDIVNKLKPDLILFTGDLVNNESSEVVPYMDIFSQLNAKYGVYSILGNHDYGDYHSWPSPEAKAANFEELLAHQKEMGWVLLRNEVAVVNIDDAQLALIGVENWSHSRNFPKYGDLQGTHAKAPKDAFKILMSHDPSHWDAQVHNFPDIPLTLSGHTHGMQLGIEIPGFRWSPSQYIYKQWAGLYSRGKQKIYVNRGFGFLGYPGRVGILPEITVINLT